ncbi:sigma-70 family RNA polymerase sigma factor [Spirosoma terrae]|uniref:Sigma-70 family RNA polymerase sigma factor n=1 Tax=Spirosoma terrae TaxID=1968276 RepID=A0A6L9L0Q2_9BACT|nr:sigma-70 family RNA polymerase sigma factor [Spirosoma terrae]NDU93880.1 sigma-70 family RNA polymerase sigma factor [Spirosoma terrae]
MFLKRFRRPKPTTDAEYISAYRATGDLAVLGELYERHMELVYAVCYNYLRDEDEAKDAVMHLFEQLVTDLRKHDVQQFQPWLHSVARNHCLMLLRKSQTHPKAVQITGATDNDTEDYRMASLSTDETDNQLLDLEEDLSRMETCLQTLPYEQRTCLTLFYLDQKSYVDVAELTGYDLKQVKSYLQNGRRMLKICMSK